MKLKQIEYLLAVADSGSFTEAARLLHLSQPALSQQIMQLEAELQVKLLDRQRGRVVLTQAGMEFRRRSERVLAASRHAAQFTRRIQRGEVGRLRVLAVSAAMIDVVPRLLAELKRKYPEIYPDIVDEHPSLQPELLRTGLADVGFFSPSRLSFGIEGLLVQSDPILVALPSRSALARKKGISVHDLRGALWLDLPRGTNEAREQALADVYAVIEPAPVEHIFESSETLIAMVGRQRAFAAVPAQFARFTFPGVTFRPLLPIRHLDMVMAWSAKKPSLFIRNLKLAARSLWPDIRPWRQATAEKRSRQRLEV